MRASSRKLRFGAPNVTDSALPDLPRYMSVIYLSLFSVVSCVRATRQDVVRIGQGCRFTDVGQALHQHWFEVPADRTEIGLQLIWVSCAYDRRGHRRRCRTSSAPPEPASGLPRGPLHSARR